MTNKKIVSICQKWTREEEILKDKRSLLTFLSIVVAGRAGFSMQRCMFHKTRLLQMLEGKHWKSEQNLPDMLNTMLF